MFVLSFLVSRHDPKMREKGTRDIGAEILEGIREIRRGEVGRVVTYPPVAETRARVGLSQAEFARLLGVPVRTLQEWEQGRRSPSGPARMLLTIAHKNPRALLDAAVVA
jgi:putative transcriptional regulator